MTLHPLLLRNDRRGSAAVEFAVIIPVFVVMIVGIVEVSRALALNRRLSQVTSMVADLVAREPDMTAQDLEGIYKVAEHVMAPWSAEPLGLEVLPVQSSADGKTRKVYASEASRPSYGRKKGKQKGRCLTYTELSADALPAGSSVIVVEGEYAYKPFFSVGILGAQTWTQQAIRTPRNSCVDFDGNNCMTSCF